MPKSAIQELSEQPIETLNSGSSYEREIAIVPISGAVEGINCDDPGKPLRVIGRWELLAIQSQ